ncbi:MAG TPA: sugar transferase [Hyphomicrobium sp.]|jgi:lipopolysaccharide/colanic/teichoic acid biosynthesis glycosyltransferase
MLKRTLDIVLSGLALLVLVPFLLPIALALRLTGEGEIFYLQERIGRYGRPFRIFKFATMLKDSPNLAGGDVTVGNDPRVLPLGQILRATKINELPQLWNILVGDMSIIGPRPLTPRIYAPFPDSYKKAIAPLRPGLSGIGSVEFRDEERLLSNADNRDNDYVELITPYKAALEEWYARNCSVTTDLRLIVLTVVAVLKPDFESTSSFLDLPPPPAELASRRKASA